MHHVGFESCNIFAISVNLFLISGLMTHFSSKLMSFNLQHEKHKSKNDPEHAHKHKVEEEIAAVAAVGSGGFAFHEHHDKKEAKEEEKEAHGLEKKHHHLF